MAELKVDTTPALTMEDIQRFVADADPNPAKLVFPTDRWGFTTDIRKAVLRAAGSVRGQDDKQLLLIGTLAVLMQHIKIRKEGDKIAQDARLAERAAQEEERQRIQASPTNPVSE